MALEAIRSVGDNGRESARTFDLSRDLAALESAIRSVDGCRLVVIDPVTAYLGGVDSHKNAEIRGLLAPLGAIAERHRVAMVAVTHLNKSGGGPAIYRAMGSLAFAAAARAAWVVSKDKDDPCRRLLLPIKNNIAPDTGGLAYRIEPLGVDGCPAVAWEPDAVNVSADDALAGDRDESGGRTERDDAADWLRELLTQGPRPPKDIEREAREAGHSFATVRRAKAATGVASRKSAFGGPWEWTLPAPTQHAQPAKARTEDAHSPSGERLGEKQAEIDRNPPKMLKREEVSTLGVGERAGNAPTETGYVLGERLGVADGLGKPAHLGSAASLVTVEESIGNRCHAATNGVHSGNGSTDEGDSGGSEGERSNALRDRQGRRRGPKSTFAADER